MFLLVVPPTVVFSQQPNSQTGCESRPVTFSVSISAPGPISYQWRFDGFDIPGATGPSYTIPAVQFADAGMYDVSVTTQCASGLSDVAVLTVIPFAPPAITSSPQSAAVCEGDSVTFDVQAAGAPPLSYQWRRDGILIAGATSPTLVIDPVMSTDAGDYDVLVSDLCSSVSSDVAQLTVGSLPVITRQPIDRTVAAGEGVTFVVEAVGGSPTYQWRMDGTDIPGATASTYVIPLVTAMDEGSYDVVVASCGSVVSDTATLTLVMQPTTARLSISSLGAQADEDSDAPSISADGRFVTFVSDSTTLVAGLTDGRRHVYLRDRQSATTTAVDMSSAGWQTDDDSTSGSISADGRWIAFAADAANIVPADTGGFRDVFLTDTLNATFRRISVSTGGDEADGPSLRPRISAGAGHVVFESDAANLVPLDTNQDTDIFVHAIASGVVRRLSVDSVGGQANGPSARASISSDGRFVAFQSAADNLVAGDANGVEDVFVHDRDPDQNGILDEGNGLPIRVSVDSAGTEGDGPSAGPAISGDGRWVAFESRATNLVPGDTNDSSDVFVYDLTLETVIRVSLADGGVEGDDDSTSPAILDGGRFVVFLSRATNLAPNDTNNVVDVFLHDRDPDDNGIFDEGNQTTTRVSVRTGGTQANADCASPDIGIASGNLFVVFESLASSLVHNDTNGRADVFRHRPAGGTTDRLSVDDAGAEAAGASHRPDVSGNGEWVLFVSSAGNLTPGDHNGVADVFTRRLPNADTEIRTRGWAADGDAMSAAISHNGQYVVFSSWATNLASNGTVFSDVFIRDLQTGEVSLVSADSTGGPGDSNSEGGAVSADGRFVAFSSAATNLAPGDLNGTRDVFRHDRMTGETILVSVDTSGAQANGFSERPVISAGGRYVAFVSDANNLVPNDTNGKRDIFVRDVVAATTTRVSVNSAGLEANNHSGRPSISADGNLISFQSAAGNLVTPDGNGVTDIFVHDRLTGVTWAASVDANGVVGNDGSGRSSLSFDGQFIAFASGATNLVPNDNNFRVDVFVRDLAAGSTTIASINSATAQGDGGSGEPALSSGGRYVAFSSGAANLVPGDDNNRDDVFIHDTAGCLAPSILLPPVGGTIFLGQPLVLTVTAIGTPPLAYQWRHDGVPIPGATASIFTIMTPTESDAGEYDVEVANACGAVTSAAATITVDLCSPETSIASTGDGGTLVGESAAPAVSADGRYVAFHSRAGTVVPGGVGNSYTDVFVHDRHTGRIVAISLAPTGRGGNSSSHFPSISADGRFVAFQSAASDLVPGDTNGFTDVFVRDRDPDENGGYDEGNAVTTRISVTSTGQQADLDSRRPSISADGRFVAFESDDPDLAPGGNSNPYHVYVHDRVSGETLRVSVNSAGAAANDVSDAVAISANGRYVAFRSRATNLDPAVTVADRDIFVHDRLTGITVLASADAAGNSAIGDVGRPAMSANGLFVSFVSDPPLVPSDTNGFPDAYVRRLAAGITSRVSLGPAGIEANAGSFLTAISGDGRLVAFYSDASNLIPADPNAARDAFIHDRLLGLTSLVTADGNGNPANGPSGVPSLSRTGLAISADAEYVAFISAAGNLVANDPIGVFDVFARSIRHGITARIATSSPGVSGTQTGRDGSVSADGRYVVFQSDASNLVVGDTNGEADVFLHDRLTGSTLRFNLSPSGEQTPVFRSSGFPRISADGSAVAYWSTASNLVANDNNDRGDVFVYDVQRASTVIVSISTTGQQGDDDSGSGMARGISTSADGRLVAFGSRATNLVPNDTNGDPDVFVHDRDPDQNGVFDEGNGVTIRVSVDSQGNQAVSWSDLPDVSADGRFVAFRSADSALVPGDLNNRYDIFVHDLTTGATELVSVDSAGVQANEHCGGPAISGDGNFVAFDTLADNLVPGDTNQKWDIFVRDRQAGTTIRASVDSNGMQASDNCEFADISSDGRFVSFDSYADNLVLGDTNAVADVFLRDTVAGVTLRVSVGSAGEQADRSCTIAAMSADAGLIVFQTDTRTLTPNVTNHSRNILIHDRRQCLLPEVVEPPEGRSAIPGEPAAFQAVVDGKPQPTLQWRHDGVPIFGATDRILVIDHVTFTDAGAYDVVATNEVGTTTSSPAPLVVLPSGGVLPGDLNCDGVVGPADIQPFVLALIDTAAYAAAFPACNSAAGDTNGDSRLDGRDVPRFVELVTGG